MNIKGNKEKYRHAFIINIAVFYLMFLLINFPTYAEQSVQLPDGTAVTIRQGETPEQAWVRAQKMYPEAFNIKIPNEKKYDIEYYNDCILKHTKNQTSNAAIRLAMNSCEYKAIPKKCREYKIETSPTGVESGQQRMQCIDECKKSNYFSNNIGECSKG